LPAKRDRDLLGFVPVEASRSQLAFQEQRRHVQIMVIGWS
jgi:hypothetical protein